MDMGNYISEQLAMFARAILLGGSLGLVYDLFGAVRTLGGRFWGGLLDVIYCALAVSSLFLFVMAGDGEMRIFVLAGALGGAVLFFCLLSRPLRPLWAFWLKILLSPLRAAAGLAKKLVGFARKWQKALSFLPGMGYNGQYTPRDTEPEPEAGGREMDGEEVRKDRKETSRQGGGAPERPGKAPQQ